MNQNFTFFLFILFTVVQTANALDNNVYVQTLNMGNEEYFVEDNTIYPNSKTETVPSVQYNIQNNYSYLPYTYPNYLYSTGYGYGTYTVTSPIYRTIYNPSAYIQTKPFAATYSGAPRTQTVIRKNQKGAFAYKY